jgi:glycosyltransferase involved in cell wall biosynthesis
MGLEKSIELRPFCDNPIDFLEDSDIFAFASEFEGFGLVLVEAMSVALPIVASNIYPVNHIVKGGDTGILVTPKNPIAFAEAINHLLSNDELRRVLGDRGRERAEQEFSKEAMFRKTWDVYSCCVNSTTLKIRLLHIITSLDQGGAESMLTRLASGLGTEFEHCVVSLTGGETANEKKIVEAGGKVINLKMNNFFGILSAVFSIRNEIRKYQPDIIQTWLYHADLMGLLVKRVAGKRPLVWGIRCSALAFTDAPWSTHLLLRLLSVFSFVPEAVVFNSSVGRNSHKNLGYQSRIEKVIHNGFDLTEWRIKPGDRLRFRNEIGTPEYGFLVGMVARFHSIKDHRCFLLAAERIHATNPHARFVMVGSGMEIQNVKLVKDIQELGLGKVVCLVGPRIDMVSVLSGLDCLVLTSKSEGFPNVLGEAMSVGIPCVSTDAGDARLILDGVGAVIPVGDAEGVANAVSDIIKSDPASRRLISIRGRERIQDRFEISDVLLRYSALYKDLDGNKKIKI